MRPVLTNREINDISSQQVYTLERKIHKGEFSIESVGDYLPGNVLVTDLSKLATVYMNKSGCNILKHSVEELEAQGPEYFQNFFVPEEINYIVRTYLDMQQKQNPAGIFNFVHRVKAPAKPAYKWYFASAKLLYTPGEIVSDKVIVIVNEVNSLGTIAKKINSVLEESDWMKKNFKKFCSLTKREKDIIILLVNGKNSSEISDALFISKLTVNTHRRNIAAKLEVKNFAGLYKFAINFGLVN
ncbi:response regulator transcription factor [Terrimonas pollutisoli]|uniref:response regulator transcription factor n=1 Tax=Terrimonas pollutisoli TaxID=3034147 RepID=UPI0023EB7912|nr:helix-turn-helix transcriptional regulator [Terrimonas sp. H1YJ31]